MRVTGRGLLQDHLELGVRELPFVPVNAGITVGVILDYLLSDRVGTLKWEA